MKILYKGCLYESLSFHLNDDFYKWFSGSLIADDKGNPIPCYRGEHGNNKGNDFHSRFKALSFTPDYKMAELYATIPNNNQDIIHSPRIGRYYLKVVNPLINDKTDPFMSFEVLESLIGFNLAKDFFLKNVDDVGGDAEYLDKFMKGVYDWNTYEISKLDDNEFRSLYITAYVVLDDNNIIDVAISKGYDGAISEDMTHGVPEIRVFNIKNIRSAI